LRAHHNVIPLAESRRERERQSGPVMVFADWSAAPTAPSHPAAQALLAGLMQGIGEREKDEALLDAGRRLAEAAQTAPPAASGWRWRANAIWTWLGLGKRRRTC
jgi:hypothetical protein